MNRQSRIPARTAPPGRREPARGDEHQTKAFQMTKDDLQQDQSSVEPPSVRSAERAVSVGLQALRAAAAEAEAAYDAVMAKCPVNNPRLDGGRSRFGACTVCSAESSGNCGKMAFASDGLIAAYRAALAACVAEDPTPQNPVVDGAGTEKQSAVEAIAQIIYEMNPAYEGGEFVDGFPVSVGGHLSWDQARHQHAEFGDDTTAGSCAEECYRAARQILAVVSPPPADAPSQVGGWLDIASAPQDGSAVIAICASAYTPTATETWWADGWQTYTPQRRDEKWAVGVHKWFPTHWQPLPGPPSETAIVPAPSTTRPESVSPSATQSEGEGQ